MSEGSPTTEPEGLRHMGLRAIVIVVALVVVVLAPLWARALTEGRHELALADAAAEAGDREAEIRQLGRAARWRLPLASHDDEARERLASLGRAGEREDRLPEALTAWRELRSALLGSRALRGVADHEQLDEANQQIARLMVLEAERAGQTIDAERLTAELAEPPATDSTRTRLAALAFVGWVASALGFVIAGIDPQGRLRPRRALRWAMTSLLLLIIWLLII